MSWAAANRAREARHPVKGATLPQAAMRKSAVGAMKMRAAASMSTSNPSSSDPDMDGDMHRHNSQRKSDMEAASMSAYGQT